MTLSRHWFAAAVIFVLEICGTAAVGGDQASPPRAEREPLPGMLAAPRSLPGVGRWQLAYKIPRGRILAIAWSSDGRQIAYQEASSIRICDSRTFETQHVLLGHTQQVRSIDWNRTTHRIASTSLDGTVHIWSAEGVPLTVLTSPHGPINCAAWAPNGERLAWGGADGTVQIVKADGSNIRAFKASDAAVNCLAWSPDARQIATGDDKHLAKIWNVDGTLAVTMPEQQSPVTRLAWSSTGKRLATATLGVYSTESLRYSTELRIWDTAGKEIAARSNSDQIFGLEWSPDGLSLAVLGVGQLVTLNEAGENQLSRTIGPLESRINLPSMGWSPDGKRIAFGGIGQVLILELETGELRESNPSPYVLPHYTYADWSPAGDRIAVVTTNGVEFRRTDGSLAGFVEHAILPFDGRGQIAWSPDGKRVVVRSGREPIVTDPDGGPATVPFELITPTQFVAWNAKTGLFASVARRSIRVAKPSGALELVVRAPGAVDSLRWNAAGTALLVLQVVQARNLFAVHVYNSAGKSLATLTDLKGEVDSIDISPDGKQLLLGYDAGYWEQWNLSDTSRPLRTAQAHTFGSCMDVTYSPDGTHFATVGWDGLAKLWRADGTLLRTFDGHGGPLFSASFSPDGRRFVTAGWTPTVCVWSTESNRPETIIFYPDADNSIVISADGRFLSGPPRVIDSAFVFLVEKPNGAMEVLDSAEFRQRTGEKQFGVPERAANRLRAAAPRRGVVRAGQGRRAVGRRSDPDFDIKVPHPAYTGKHPVVGIDQGHRNLQTAAGRYKGLADLLSNDGYRVSAIHEPFTARGLDDYDVLIVANALLTPNGRAMQNDELTRNDQQSAFTQDERESIQNWVRGGGGLLLITNQRPYGPASAKLAKSFGVEMGLQLTFNTANPAAEGLAFTREKNQLGDHAILRGRNEAERINRVLTFNGQSLKGPPESVALLKFADTATDVGPGTRTSAAGRAQAVALKFGRGRVVVLGEGDTLSAEIYGNPPRRVGMNVPDCDNRQLALNIVHWLSGLID